MIVQSKSKKNFDYVAVIERRKVLIYKDIEETITEEEKQELRELNRLLNKPKAYIRRPTVLLNKERSGDTQSK